jgi:hypothetical protein
MFASLLVPLLALTASPPSFNHNDDPVFDWPGAGRAFLATNNSVSNTDGLVGLLESEHFAHVDLGSFQLYIPTAQLQQIEQAELFQEYASIALELQGTWHSWRSTNIDREDPAADWLALQKWVDSWKPKHLIKLQGGAQAINSQIKGFDDLAEMQAVLADNTQTNPPMEEYLGTSNRIVLAPSRRDFIELLAVAGLLEEAQQEYAWDEANLTRTAAWVDWVEVLCLEEAGYPFDLANPFASQDMNRDEPNARTQFVADRIVLQLMRKEFYPNGTHFFELSLGTNLVISALGHNNSKPGDWNVSYKTAGGKTAAYERFVPGGNAAGGQLPPRKAFGGAKTGSAAQVSRSRATGGAKFFQASLLKSQKEATKLAKKDKQNPLAKNKLAHFILHSFENNTDTFISAPFLGPLAEKKTLPADEYIDDYEDFFRAYRSGFFNWLISNTDKDTEKSQASFAQLIRNQSERELDVSFLAIIEEVYGMPISAVDDSEDSLEWRYLAWIKKSK